MKRRNFLSLAGAAVAAPLMPIPVGASASAAVGYNRYMYGLALFHARTRATISAADIAARLRVSASTAEAMIGEMARRGALKSTATTGTMRAVSLHNLTSPQKANLVKKAVQNLTANDGVTPEPKPCASNVAEDTIAEDEVLSEVSLSQTGFPNPQN